VGKEQKMNDRIAKLYDMALVLNIKDDSVSGEFDPVLFAELIERECISAIEAAAVEKPLSEYYIKKIRAHMRTAS